ncbi:MAG: LAGLIDADG family homing endonuclease [Nanoarchaeota archaeon]
MDIYELIGFIIGDGNIYHSEKHKIWRLELSGNVDEDYDYFLQIKKFLVDYTRLNPQFYIRNSKKGRCLTIAFYNKKFIDELISYGLPVGKKTFTITIPKGILEKDYQMISLVRGLFEADGCIYFSKSKKTLYPTYPRVEIKTSSPNLLEQLKTYLKGCGFNIYTRKSISDRTFAVGVSGEKSIEKWREIFGLRSLKNQTKYDFWKTKGFYIPRTPLKSRMQYAHVAQW